MIDVTVSKLDGLIYMFRGKVPMRWVVSVGDLDRQRRTGVDQGK